MTGSAISPRLADTLRSFVVNADAPGAAAAAMVGAIMSAIGAMYGDEAAAEILYTVADATVTRASAVASGRARGSHA